MRFLRRKKERPSTGFAPLVSNRAFEKSDKCDTSSNPNEPNPAESNPFGGDPFANNPFGNDPYEPPVFEHAKTSEVTNVTKNSSNSISNKTKKVESKAGKVTPEKNDSIDIHDESTASTTISIDRMTDIDDDVRPVLISVKEELLEPMESTEVFPTPQFTSPPRQTDSSYDIERAFSEDPFKMSPTSPAFPASPMSATSGSVFTLSEIGTSTMTGYTMDQNESTMTGISTLDSSWDCDSTTRYTRDSEFDVTTQGSESCTNRRSKRKFQWKLPQGLPNALKEAVYLVQDMVEDLSRCGACVTSTTERTVCGPEEDDEPRVKAWRQRRMKDQTSSKGK